MPVPSDIPSAQTRPSMTVLGCNLILRVFTSTTRATAKTLTARVAPKRPLGGHVKGLRRPLKTLRIRLIGMVGCLMCVSPTIKSVSSQTSVSSLMPTASVESSSYPRSITNKDVDNSYPSSQKEAVLSDYPRHSARMHHRICLLQIKYQAQLSIRKSRLAN